MQSALPIQRSDLPTAVVELAARLGAKFVCGGADVALAQKGRMKRALGKDAWMSFSARQSIKCGSCDFAWRARFGPFGMVEVCDALERGVGRLDVTALGLIPIVRTPNTLALVRGELMRYLAEIPWTPDAILENTALRWRDDGSGGIVVGAGDGAGAAEIVFGLDHEGRIATTFAPDRARATIDPILPTPWRGRFTDYRLHNDRWIPFAAEVAWEIDGREDVYWQGTIASWSRK
jgi:hypothetical protein